MIFPKTAPEDNRLPAEICIYRCIKPCCVKLCCICEHAKECEERWEMLVGIYKEYETGTSYIHSLLYEQLDECFNGLPNTSPNEEGTQLYDDLPGIFPEGNEEIDESTSLFPDSPRAQAAYDPGYDPSQFFPDENEDIPLSPSQEERCFIFFDDRER